MSAPREHNLKIWPSYFAAILDGTKTFEARKNDRDFEVGDLLVLEEFQPDQSWRGGYYTGRRTTRLVTYMLRGGEFGVEVGHCILALAPVLERCDPVSPTAGAQEPEAVCEMRSSAEEIVSGGGTSEAA